VSRLRPFGPYELAERVGVGSLGEVFRAFSRQSGKVVALKRLSFNASHDREVIETLREEAQISRALDHPAITKVTDIGHVEDIHYIAYEYVHGRDLRALTERAAKDGGELPIDVALHVILRVCEALAHAHERRSPQGKPLGMVHRDVSPPNIMISLDGEVKLLDFGIAWAEGRSARTAEGQVKGTMGYMSPEQAQGDRLDARSDIYSLGVCLWELAAGKRLFHGVSPIDVAKRVVKGDIPPPSTPGRRVSAALERIVLKALAHSPDERYASALQFHSELSDLARTEGLLTDSTRVARYVRSVFPEVAADGAASREECLDMAENKGGSDLDVFEGLAKKSTRPANPNLAPPPPSMPPRKSTLMGGVSALPPPAPPPTKPGSVPPPPGALPPPVAPPKVSGAAPEIPKPPGTLQGMPPAPPPPPPPAGAASLPPVVPPPKPPGSLPAPAGALPAPLPPPPAAGTAVLPPVSAPPQLAAPGVLPPVSAPPIAAGSAPPPPPPAGSLPAPLPPPKPPAGPASLGTALGLGEKKNASGKAAVDMDWDDEEESTHVYDKAQDGAPMPTGPRPAAGAPAGNKVSAAAALLAGSGSVAPAARAPSAHSLPPAPPIPSIPPQQAVPAAPPRLEEATAIRPRPFTPGAAPAPSGGRAGAILGGLALLVVIGLAVFMFLPKKGKFKIDLSTKDGGAVDTAEIFVDGQKKCDTAPCVISDLDPGDRTIKIKAAGFAQLETVKQIEAGKETYLSLKLEGGSVAPSNTSTVSANATGLKVGATDTQKNVKVSIDGTDKGTLPLDLKDLTPGTHKLKLDGGERYEKVEQTVELSAGQTKDLGTIKLKVLKGQVTLELVTNGAGVTLVRRTPDGKKDEKKLPDSLWKSPPVKIDVNPSEGWKLVAVKKGFDEFSRDLTFDDGEAEKTIRIELSETGKAAPVDTTPPPAGTTTTPPGKTAEPPAKTAEPPATGNGTLNINSIPVSKVVLDGRPLGSTPKVGVSVPAGSHTVTFIHPELGKKSVTVQVKPGETKTAAVKFK
jgi:serine/threonine protein kinase